MPTIDELEQLCLEEAERIKAKKARTVQAQGAAEIPDGSSAGQRGSMLLEANVAQPSSGRKQSKADKQKGPAPVIEITDDGTSGRKTASESVNFNFIMWGHSQRTQLAGVPSPA